MAIDTRLLGQIKQALAKNLVKQAAPPTFPAERPNPAAAPFKPAPAPTSVDKAISASRAAAPTGPTSADLAIQATRRQNALGRGQLATGTAPGASMAAPDYASARQLEDLTRSENVRANMQNAGKYVADAASSAVGFGRSALDNAAAIKKHMDHASSSPVGYLASLGQNSGSDFLDRVGTSLVDPEASRPYAPAVASGANVTPNEYANYQANRATESLNRANGRHYAEASPVSGADRFRNTAASAARAVLPAAMFNSPPPINVTAIDPYNSSTKSVSPYGYPPVPGSGNYNDPYARLNIDDDQPTYQRLQRLPRPGDNPSWNRPRFPGQTLRGMTMTGFDSLTPNRPYVPTMSGMQPSPPADYLSYTQQEIERNKPRS